MRRLIVLPVDFDVSGNPKDKTLHDGATMFLEGELGIKVNLRGGLKVWAAAEVGDDLPPVVVGVSAMAYAIDCHAFHVKAGNEGTAWDRDRARAARDLLVGRMSGFVQDNVGASTRVLVYVSPEQQRYWAPYLRAMKAQPANRHIITV